MTKEDEDAKDRRLERVAMWHRKIFLKELSKEEEEWIRKKWENRQDESA